MYKNDDVAIVMVNYNGFQDSKQCIDSIIKSDVQSKIVFVDNASEENEGDRIYELYKNVHCIRTDFNNGYSAGCNIGIKYAIEKNYKYIMILNNDTVIDPQMIDFLRKETDKNTICVPKMLYYSEPQTIWYGGGKINKMTGKAVNLRMGELDDGDRNCVQCTFATGCCLMLHADTIKKIGLMDESYFLYCEDEEFSLRAMKNGVRIVYVPLAKLWHKVSKSTGGEESAICFYYLTRNRLKCIKEYKEYFWNGALLFTLVSRCIRACQFKIKGNINWRAFFRGIEDFQKDKYGKAESLM